ncbi:hypothetical protein J2W27_000946 [Variovorax boronicumulans]|uniref:Ig-like domain-containing protein n=1 Tax=Variovorax boronicumulans TaxID=436515 RepID=UPI002786B4C0|nr:Ig-like domain-containing protein [Variovorax boronicumulans]MDP9908853.1 hypothetical protein [Variovorax boronicumulans]
MALEQTNSVAPFQNIDLASTFAPPPPYVGSAADDAGDILGSIAHGGVTDDRQPEFGGQGTPGDTIVIRDNGNEIGTTEVADDGTWTFTPSTDLLEGQHAITIVTRDDNGNESAPSPAFNFEIDVTPPDASRLNVSGFMDNAGGIAGNVISGGTTDETCPLLSGISTGTPGHTVTVMVKDATGTHELGLATIGENGQWTFQVDTPLAAGLNTFMLVERDAAGNETMPTGRYKVTVSTDKPNAPVIDSVFDDVGEPHMLQPGEVTNDARPTLAGTAQANHTVKFYDGSTYLGEAVADASGNWSFTPTVGLTDGTHGITATSTSPKGQTSGASKTWNFVVDTVAPKTPLKLLADGANVDVYFDAADAKAGDTVRVFFGDRQVDHVLTGVDVAAGKVSLADAGQPSKAVIIDPAGNVSPERTPTGAATIDKVYDDQGSITGDLLPGAVTDDNQPDISGRSEPNSTVLIKDHGVVIGQAQADAAGHWTFKSPMLLADGAHSLTATGVGKDGIAGAPSNPFDFTVDAKAPLAPSIESVFDNEGPDHGTVTSGIVTDDATPVISGKAEPNSTVIVYGNGVELGRAPVDGAGQWTFEPNPPLENGAYKLTAKAVDAAGNISVPSNDFNFVLDKDLSTGDDHPRELLEGKGSFNATLMVDTSGSMSGPLLASVKQTLKDLAATYLEMSGSVTLTLLGEYEMPPQKFSFTSDTDTGYLSYVAAVNALSAGWFSYEATVLSTMESIKADYLAGKGPSQVFILGDTENHLSRETADKWQAMLKDPDGDGNSLAMPIVSTPISFIPLGGPYAYTFEWLASDKAIGVPTPEMLPEILLGSSVADTVSGNLLGNDVKITVDGKERLSQVTFEGGVFRVTSDNKLVVENASGKVISAAYDASSGLLTVATVNGWLKVYMQNSAGHKAGDYSYAAKFATLYSLESSVKEVYGYTVVDSKETSQASKLHIGIQQPSPSELLKISSLGKDTGVAGDSVTADGSAGRAITGTLSMSLAAGLKVQVSVDGGKTWKDAVVNGKNWAFVDFSAHTSDWTYQVRISDGVKHGADVLSQEVTLVDVPGAPTILRIPDAEGFYTYTKASDGSQVLLSLAGTGAKAGDTVHVQWGSTTYDQVLTQLDINSGIATVNVPSTATYSYQGYTKDFAVTAQIISKDGALGAVSKPYQVVVTAALTASSDTLQKAPVGDVYTGTGFKVTTTGTLAKTVATTTALAGLTLNDTTQANALFTLDKPANYFTLRLTGIDNAMGAQIQVFDVKGNLIHTENFIGGTDARHTKVFTYTSAELVDIGSFQVISLSPSVTLDAFSQQVVNHVAETRDPNLIEYAPETFYGGTGNDLVSLSVSATTYFNQATAGIHGGSGIDTLKLEGYAHVLDLTKVGGKLSSMEVIDITGSYYNTLTLSLAEVLNNGGVDLFYKGDKSRVQMMIKGSSDDIVNLSDLLAGGIDQGDWVKKVGVVTLGGVVYDSYQHSSLAAELLVQQGVTVKVTNSTLVGVVGTFEAPSDAMPDALPDDEVLSHSTQGYTHGDDTLIARLGFADRLSGGAGNDTFTNVGTGDTVHGGSGNDTIRINSGDFARVEGSLGIDTLVMDGKAMHIDLTAFGLKIQGIEKFDLGAGGNTLALHASDVLAGGMRDMVTADGKVQMLVNGANGDVNLLGGNDSWTQGGNTTVGDVTYSVYTNLAGTAELLVEDKVHVTIL